MMKRDQIWMHRDPETGAETRWRVYAYFVRVRDLTPAAWLVPEGLRNDDVTLGAINAQTLDFDDVPMKPGWTLVEDVANV